MPFLSDMDVMIHIILIFATGITLVNVGIEWQTDKRRENISFVYFVILYFIYICDVTVAFILKYYSPVGADIMFTLAEIIPLFLYSLVGTWLCSIIELKEKMHIFHKLFLKYSTFVTAFFVTVVDTTTQSLIGYQIFVILLFGSFSLVIFYYRRAIGRGETAILIVFFFALAGMSIQTYSEYTAIDVTSSLFLTALHFQLWQKRAQSLTVAQKNIAVLEASLAKSRMETALSQIQPHFIYNTLSTVSALCEIDPKKAQQVTNSFAEYLRYDLNLSKIGLMIDFKTELEHTKNYLSIEKIRFGDRLNAVYDIKFDSFELPSLSLQPIVENAVRHGIMQKKKGGTITVSSWTADGFVFVSVKDDGVGFDTNAEKSDGYGIKCTRERILLMPDGRFTVESEIGVGTTVTIRIKRGDMT